jgi:guanylate kinase
MNELVHIDDFHAALENYHLSKVALQTLSQTKLVLLVAPSSTGRNTIIWQLLKTGDYHFVVSDTTRKPRVNDGVLEQTGHEYWFRSEDEILADIQAGKYLEAAVIHNQQVSGISVRELQVASDQGKIAITDAEIEGADNATKYKPDTTAIFVLPPSFDEWQRRIKHRGEMEPGEFRRRMESAAKEFETALQRNYYKFVINDSVEHSVEQIHQIAKLDIVDTETQIEARNLAEQLLLATQTFLESTDSQS